ncbi:hypothetical protein ACJX0J_018968, partial [Zea mays]
MTCFEARGIVLLLLILVAIGHPIFLVRKHAEHHIKLAVVRNCGELRRWGAAAL